MRIISFGDLYCDYYIKNGKDIYVSGGKSDANILVNLSRYFKCAYFGVCGNDPEGKIAVSSLKDVGIETYIREVQDETKTFFIDDGVTSKICPYCKKRYGYSGTKMEFSDIKIDKDDYIVVDNLRKFTLDVLKKYDNEAFLDLGSNHDILDYGYEELTDLLKGRFSIISLNERVYYYLKDKFLVDSYDLYDNFSPKILIITRGKRGCDVIYNDKFLKKTIEEPTREVSESGAGDAFISEFIRTYIEEKKVDDKMISKSIIRALTNSSKCVKSLGARGHIIKPYKVTSYEKCICRSIDVK